MGNQFEPNPNSSHEKILKAFSDLSLEVHRQGEKQLEDRLGSNPVPTADDLNLGFYVEDLEWPVRDAVLTFRHKGYNTYWSGFGTRGDEYQDIRGYFNLDGETVKKLKTIGVEVKNSGFSDDSMHCFIEFKPSDPDPLKIKQKWDQIAEILPDVGKPSEKSKDFYSRKYLPGGFVSLGSFLYLSSNDIEIPLSELECPPSMDMEIQNLRGVRFAVNRAEGVVVIIDSPTQKRIFRLKKNTNFWKKFDQSLKLEKLDRIEDKEEAQRLFEKYVREDPDFTKLI